MSKVSSPPSPIDDTVPKFEEEEEESYESPGPSQNSAENEPRNFTQVSTTNSGKSYTVFGCDYLNVTFASLF